MGKVRQGGKGKMALVLNLIITRQQRKILKSSHKHFKLNKSKIKFNVSTSNLFPLLYSLILISAGIIIYQFTQTRNLGDILVYFPSFSPLPTPSKRSPTPILFHLSISPLSPKALNSVLHFCKNCQFLGLPCPQAPSLPC